MAFRRSPVRSRSGPPSFAHDRRRRMPAIARSAEAGLSTPRTSFGWQAIPYVAPTSENRDASSGHSRQVEGIAPRSTSAGPLPCSSTCGRTISGLIGVQAMRDHRKGRLTLRSHRIEPITVPAVDSDFVRETREGLHMSRQVFAFTIGVNPRTLERWEQGRSKPNEQASALIRLVRKYPDTIERLESLSVPA